MLLSQIASRTATGCPCFRRDLLRARNLVFSSTAFATKSTLSPKSNDISLKIGHGKTEDQARVQASLPVAEQAADDVPKLTLDPSTRPKASLNQGFSPSFGFKSGRLSFESFKRCISTKEPYCRLKECFPSFERIKRCTLAVLRAVESFIVNRVLTALQTIKSIISRVWIELDASPPALSTWPEAKRAFAQFFGTLANLDSLILKAKEVTAESLSAAALRIIEIYLFYKAGTLLGMASRRAVFASN